MQVCLQFISLQNFTPLLAMFCYLTPQQNQKKNPVPAECLRYCKSIAVVNATLLPSVYSHTQHQDTDNICAGATRTSRDCACLSFEIICCGKLEGKAMRCPPTAQLEHKIPRNLLAVLIKLIWGDTHSRQRGNPTVTGDIALNVANVYWTVHHCNSWRM